MKDRDDCMQRYTSEADQLVGALDVINEGLSQLYSLEEDSAIESALKKAEDKEEEDRNREAAQADKASKESAAEADQAAAEKQAADQQAADDSWEETANLFAMKGPWRTFQFRDDLKPFIGGMLSGK